MMHWQNRKLRVERNKSVRPSIQTPLTAGERKSAVMLTVGEKPTSSSDSNFAPMPSCMSAKVINMPP